MKKANIGVGERLISGVLGAGFLAIAWRKRKPFSGVLGAEFFRRAASGHSYFYGALGADTRWPKSFTHSFDNEIYRTHRSVTIDRPREELYSFWRDVLNRRGSKITEELPNDRISWRTSPDSDLELSGQIQFTDAPGNRGTEVHGELRYRMPGGKLGWALAKSMGREPDQQLRADLRRFKKLMETGEIITTEGQPSGRVAA